MGECVVACVATDGEACDCDCFVGSDVRISELPNCVAAVQVDRVARDHTRKRRRVCIKKGSGITCVVVDAV